MNWATIFGSSVELQCHVLDEGRRKNTLSTDMDIAAHAIA